MIWEQPMPYGEKSKNPGGNSSNWITPCVQEQYVFWMPVNRAAAIMIEAYWQAYVTTGKEIYLAKAKSIANAMTVVQKGNQGIYSTMSYIGKWNYWLNSTVYPAQTMMRLQENLEALNQ